MQGGRQADALTACPRLHRIKMQTKEKPLNSKPTHSKRRATTMAAVLLAAFCLLIALREMIGPNVIVHNKTNVPIEQVTFNLGYFYIVPEDFEFGRIEPGKRKRKRVKIVDHAQATLRYVMNGKPEQQDIDLYIIGGMTGNLEIHVSDNGIELKEKLKIGF